MKKITSIILTVCMILTAMIVPAAAAAAIKLEIGVSDAAVEIGDQITVAVTTEAISALDGVQLTLEYDGTLLEFVSASNYNNESAEVKHISDSNEVRTVTFHMSAISVGEGTALLTVNFKAIAAGTASFSLSTCKLGVDGASSAAPVEISAEKVTISAPHVCAFDKEVATDDYLATEATCTEPATYYYSCECGAKGTETFSYGEENGHDWSTVWSKDSTGHWHDCKNCDAIDSVHEHNPGAAATADKAQTCTDCGFEVAPALGHKTDSDWTTDENYHWQNCSCGKAHNKEEHSASRWYNEDNVRYRTCKVCGYLMDYEVIEDNGNWYDTIIALRSRKYKITAEAGEGGKISDEGATTVRFGQNITYTITPNAGYEIDTVIVDGKDIGAVSEYTFKNVRKAHTIKVTFKEAWFTDVSKDASYYKAVKWAVENGLFEGVSETRFAPDSTMTRAMFVTVLGRLAGVDASAYTGAAFDDVVEGEWYAPYVKWAAENGIVLGYGDGTFGVNNEITIEQAVVIMARYAKFAGIDIASEASLDSYTDASEVADWAADQMKWATENGIYTGAGNKLSPKDPAKRSLVAEILYAYVTKLGK